jgi:hypothetical protein
VRGRLFPGHAPVERDDFRRPGDWQVIAHSAWGDDEIVMSLLHTGHMAVNGETPAQGAP